MTAPECHRHARAHQYPPFRHTVLRMCRLFPGPPMFYAPQMANHAGNDYGPGTIWQSAASPFRRKCPSARGRRGAGVRGSVSTREPYRQRRQSTFIVLIPLTALLDAVSRIGTAYSKADMIDRKTGIRPAIVYFDFIAADRQRPFLLYPADRYVAYRDVPVGTVRDFGDRCASPSERCALPATLLPVFQIRSRISATMRRRSGQWRKLGVDSPMVPVGR